MMKRILVTIYCMIAIIGSYSLYVEAMERMDITTEVQSTTRVKLKWKKRSGIDGYKIYREIIEDGDSKLILIADLGKNKTSYVDKKIKPNTSYSYEISGYCKKDGKEIEKFWGCESVTTDVSKAVNYFEEFEDGMEGIYGRVTALSDQITIPIGLYEKGAVIDIDIRARHGLRPDGVEVFKKVGKKYVSYRKIKIKNNKKKLYYFTDKKVKRGKNYRYKFRTYKKMNGKMKYTPLTGAFVVCAMNNHPSVDIKVVEEFDIEKKMMTVCIVNKEDYGALTDFTQWTYYRWDTDQKGAGFVSMEMTEYSYDNNLWYTDFKQCKIKPGKTMYIKLKVADENFDDIITSSQLTEDIDFYFKHKFYSYSYEYQITDNKKHIYHE